MFYSETQGNAHIVQEIDRRIPIARIDRIDELPTSPASQLPLPSPCDQITDRIPGGPTDIHYICVARWRRRDGFRFFQGEQTFPKISPWDSMFYAY
jgi:hypothetical protein